MNNNGERILSKKSLLNIFMKNGTSEVAELTMIEVNLYLYICDLSMKPGGKESIRKDLLCDEIPGCVVRKIGYYILFIRII